MDQLMSRRSAAGVPTSTATLDPSLPLSDLAPRVVGLLRDLFKTWSALDDSRFLVETVSGGITNLLLKVSVKEGYGNVSLVTVRLYGLNTELVIDRKREMHALPTLSDAGFGAELLAVFGNGMVQSFINAHTLSPKDMSIPKVAAEVARQLRRFHQVEVPGSKEPQLWNDIFKFFHKASSLKFDDSKKQKMYDTISFDEVHNALIELKDLTDCLNAPVVFAHNDLLAGNLAQNEDEEKLYFIDFEYGSYSYRGYDIANHFNEYAGLECDYSLYPNKDTQLYFFKNYLQPDGLDKVYSNDLEALYVETDTFKLASHMYWALRGLIQVKVSPIEFDYLEYFFLRYNEFKKQRETTFTRAREYLGIVMENDVKIVGRGTQEEDNYVLQFLDSMDSYLDLFDALSSKLREGWLEVGSARHSMGSTRISSVLLDLKPHSAATTLQVHQLVDSSLSELPMSGVMISQHGFALSKWGLLHGVKNDFEDNHVGKESAAKSHAPQLRRRGPHGAPEEERKVPTNLPVVTDDQVKKQRAKSLSVFGAFSSPKLREAQVSFETALEIIVEIANVRSMMLAEFAKLQSQGSEGVHGVPAYDAMS